MIPGRSIVTVLPCGIVVRSSDGVVDLCRVCASTTCPAAHHDGRVCSGGCTPCRCREGSA